MLKFSSIEIGLVPKRIVDTMIDYNVVPQDKAEETGVHQPR